MRSTAPHLDRERWQAIALDLLAEKDTLAGLAHLNHVSIHQILTWKDRLLRDLGTARGRRAA